MPTATSFICDYIYYTANGVGTEAHRHDSFVYLYTLGKAHRDIVQVKRLSGSFMWHTIDENFDVFAAEAIKHKLHVGTHTTRFAEFYAG
ncbi:tonB-dependent receptor [Prevotella sp. MGM1]|nr:tonB-dependent receptor [Prevotella sp. MGM1]